MADLTLRLVKGSPLTNAEVDGNFTSLNESIMVTGEPMGHANKSDSVLSFNAGTRTVSIAPAVTSFDVWCKGTKHTYTTAQTVVIPDTTGLHYIFFNASGVLSTRMSYFDFENEAPTAYVAWNSVTQQASFFADERHGVTLDWQTHEYLHRTRGAALANGFSISNYTIVGTGSADADAQFDLGGGTFFDEDLQVDIVSSNTPTPGTWQQDLAGPALIPVLYRSGTGWVRDTPTNFVLKAGTATPRYNTEAAGVWGLTDVPNNSYSTVWIIATNNLTYPVVAIMGQAADSNSGQVENIEWSSLNLDGFPSVEFRPLYKIVFQCSSGYTNTIKARFTKVFDIRNLVAASPAATIGSAHSGLSGLGNDDHLQYLHVTEVRSPSAAVKASFLPPQASNAGKYLKTDGSVTSWETLTNPNNGTLTMSTAGTGISGAATFTADQAGNSTFTVTLNSSAANVVNTVVLRDASGNFSSNVITANSFSGPLSGNASTASALATARTISSTGDVAWSTSFDGSGNATGTATLSTTGVSASSYGSATQVATFTVDTKGRITAASSVNITPAWSSITGTPTTLAGYGITDGQPLDADLTAIAALTGTSGFLKKTAADTWSLDTSSYATTTGGGATGTWSISISGNAATATSATSATTATTSTIWSGYGTAPAAGTSFGNANTIGRSDANGYTYFNYINSNTGNSENPTVSQVIITNGTDNFYRKASIAHLTSNLSGTAPINITGTAGTVTTVSPGQLSPLTSYTTPADASGYTWIRFEYANGNSFNAGQQQIEFYVTRSINENSDSPYGGCTAKFTAQAREWHSGQETMVVQYGEHGSNNSSGQGYYISHARIVDAAGGGNWVYLRVRAGITYYFREALIGGSGCNFGSLQGTSDPGSGQPIFAGLNLIATSLSANYYYNGSAALHAGNYNSYAPTLTGGGASGTWSINVTGNAATATSATSATSATTATSSPLLSALGNYVWSASTLPTGYNQGIQCSFVDTSWQSYGSVMTMSTYSGGGGALQMYVPYSPTYGGTGLQVRFGNYDVSSGNSWTAWKTLLASDNYNSYAPTLTGGGASGTWGISISGNAATATSATDSTKLPLAGGTLTGQLVIGAAGTAGSPTLRLNTSTSGAFVHTQESFAANLTSGQHVISVIGKVGNTKNSGYIGYTWAGDASNSNYVTIGHWGNDDLFRVYADGNVTVGTNTVLNAGNYTSYSPSLTGGGASGTWGINISGSSGGANAVNNVGYGDGTFTWYQSSGNWQTWTGGWASHLISNHGNGSTYYNQTIIMPFWGPPQYMRKEGGTNVGPYVFLTTENYTSYSPSLTGSGASGTWGINITGSAAQLGGYGSTTYIGKFGNTYYQADTWIQCNGIGGLYWPATNAAELNANTTSSYGAVAIIGSRNSWRGIHFQGGGNTPHLMFDGSANGGIYYETGGRWASYYNYSNDCWGFGSSYTDATYNVYASKGVYAGRVDANIFYDANNTAYYADPASTSNFNQINMQGVLRRNTSAAGYLEGNYPTSVDGNSSSCIYTIGGSYQPGTTNLGNMYGIGYTVGNGTSNPGLGMGGWGLYVASGGTSRIFLDSDSGTVISSGSVRSQLFYDSNNTAYYVDPTASTSANFYGSVNAATYNLAGLLVNASGTASTGGSIAIQQVTAEGWTGIFCDFEPYTGWGLWHDNPNNYFSFTAEASTGSIRSFSVPSRVSGNRTAYEKFRVDQATGDTITGRDGYAQSSFRAPIFYDNNNTGYYCDPASTSQLNVLACAGNITSSGTIAASSDERLKTNWRDLPADFVEQLAKVKAGVYDRVDEEGMTQVGVSAQSLEPLMPHAVTHNADGMLGVAYGNAALVAAVKLAERVLELERRLAALESGEK